MLVHLKKQYDGSFQPADQEAAEWAVKQKTGVVVYADFRKRRNYEFHKKYFGMLNIAHQNMPEKFNAEYPTMENLREAVQIAAGHYEVICLLNGRKGLKSKTISFAKMSQEEFEKLYSTALDVILKHFGFGEEFEIELIQQFG